MKFVAKRVTDLSLLHTQDGAAGDHRVARLDHGQFRDAPLELLEVGRFFDALLGRGGRSP